MTGDRSDGEVQVVLRAKGKIVVHEEENAVRGENEGLCVTVMSLRASSRNAEKKVGESNDTMTWH